MLHGIADMLRFSTSADERCYVVVIQLLQLHNQHQSIGIVHSRIALLFLRAPAVLGGGVKKAPGRLLRKTLNLFLFNCEPGRIELGDLNDSDFEDDRKPEIATWPPKPEVLMSPEI